MKKTFFILSLLFAGYTSSASDLCDNPIKAETAKKVSVKGVIKPVFECCSTASMPWNGATVSCTVCAETCSGSQGSEAKAADCLMDVMVPGN